MKLGANLILLANKGVVIARSSRRLFVATLHVLLAFSAGQFLIGFAISEARTFDALIWQSTFDESDFLDESHWEIVEGDGCPELCGFGNEERQVYSRATENLRIENGILVIEAHYDAATDTYSSAKITTAPLGGWTYGRIEVRAKLPRGIGTWPAIWLMPQSNHYGGWPKSGELDIMEHRGSHPSEIIGTIHTEASNYARGTLLNGTKYVPTFDTDFHVYAVEWREDRLSWFIDGQLFFSFEKPEGAGSGAWPFDQPFHLILNQAVGGHFGGTKGVDNSVFPTAFEIDWVKVWQ